MTDLSTSRADRFTAIYTAHYDEVVRFASRRTDPARAEDVAADAFTVAWRRLDDIPHRPGESLPWLYAVARNCLLNAQRASGRQDAVTLRLGDSLSTVAPTHTAVDADVAGRLDLVAAWQHLTPAEQEVLGLALFEDLPSPQAARVLGISAPAYRLRMSRARRSLRQHLAAPEESPDAIAAPSARALAPAAPTFQENSR